MMITYLRFWRYTKPTHGICIPSDPESMKFQGNFRRIWNRLFHSCQVTLETKNVSQIKIMELTVYVWLFELVSIGSCLAKRDISICQWCQTKWKKQEAKMFSAQVCPLQLEQLYRYTIVECHVQHNLSEGTRAAPSKLGTSGKFEW